MPKLAKGLNGHAQAWLWLSVLLAPAIALAGGLGFQLTGFVVGLAGLLAHAFDRKPAAYLKSAWPITLIAFALWAWASMLWSQYDAAIFGGNASLLLGLLIPLFFLPLVFADLPESTRELLIWVVIITSWLGILLLSIDAVSHHALSLWVDPVNPGQDVNWRLGQAEMNVGRGQVSYALLLWPVSALLMVKGQKGKVLAALGFLGLIISGILNDLLIIGPTVFVGAVFAGVAWKNPRLGLKGAFLLAIFSVVFAPFLGVLSSFVDPDFMRKIPLSWEHRLRMWSYSWDLIRQTPFVGHGFDSSRVFNELTFRAPDGRDITVLSLHPHNIGLQIWLETGCVGVVLAVSFLMTLMRWALKICVGRAQAFAAAGLVASVATSGAVTVGLWQHWWWALIFFAASLISLVVHKN